MFTYPLFPLCIHCSYYYMDMWQLVVPLKCGQLSYKTWYCKLLYVSMCYNGNSNLQAKSFSITTASVTMEIHWKQILYLWVLTLYALIKYTGFVISWNLKKEAIKISIINYNSKICLPEHFVAHTITMTAIKTLSVSETSPITASTTMTTLVLPSQCMMILL